MCICVIDHPLVSTEESPVGPLEPVLAEANSANELLLGPQIVAAVQKAQDLCNSAETQFKDTMDFPTVNQSLEIVGSGSKPKARIGRPSKHLAVPKPLVQVVVYQI